ncbi:COMM domain-containing 6 [Labeo rohita]|uniref:COMM domain-containing protein 6 n=1 Tax=Labeo rohita TaxID=84645 RepID=A0A498NEL6_LABRO|nr:COMM domain-containing 6 [Labeo rohita]
MLGLDLSTGVDGVVEKIEQLPTDLFAETLVDIQWKLGMAVSSDTCRSLNSPFISVLMKIADTSGEMSYKSFEMTVQQFQNFYRQFKEMASVLETV